MEEPKDATAATRAYNRAALATMPVEDGADFERVRRGFIDTLPNARIESPMRGVAWDRKRVGSPSSVMRDKKIYVPSGRSFLAADCP